MNSDQMAGKWKQMKGAAKQQWGKLTDDDLEVIDGKQDSLVGKLQERYGMAKEEAQKKASEFFNSSYDQGNIPRQNPQSQPSQSHQPTHQTGKR